ASSPASWAIVSTSGYITINSVVRSDRHVAGMDGELSPRIELVDEVGVGFVDQSRLIGVRFQIKADLEGRASSNGAEGSVPDGLIGAVDVSGKNADVAAIRAHHFSELGTVFDKGHIVQRL